MSKLFGILAGLIGIFLLVASVISFGHLVEEAWVRGGMLASLLFALLLLLGSAAFLLTAVLLFRMRSHYLPRLYELEELEGLEDPPPKTKDSGESNGPRLD